MNYETAFWLLNLTKSQREKFIKLGRLLVQNRIIPDIVGALELIRHSNENIENSKPYKVASSAR